MQLYRIFLLIFFSLLLPACAGSETASSEGTDGQPPLLSDSPDFEAGENGWDVRWDERPSGGLGSLKSPTPGPSETIVAAGGQPFWTIVLVPMSGENHRQKAIAARKRIAQAAPELADARVHSTESGSMVIYGSYPAVDDARAQQDLERIKSLTIRGRQPYALAMLSRVVPEVGSDPQQRTDLRTVRQRFPNIEPLYTLQVAVWMSDDEHFSRRQARRAAEAFAAKLRAGGHDAYYYHDPNKGTSHVTIGVFDETAYDPRSTLYAPQVEKLMKVFPEQLVNGEQLMLKETPGSRSRETQPWRSQLVTVPE